MSATVSPAAQAAKSAPLVVDAPESRLSALSQRLLYGAFLLVVAMGPFEAGYPPLGRFLFATYTNLEVTIFILAAAWLFKLAVDPAARGRLFKLPLLLPILALIGAAVLSTIFAEYGLQAVQFIYRLSMGALIYVCTWEALRGARRLLTALATLVGSATTSAILGLLEFAPWFNITGLLSVFKPQPTTVGGFLRLSGSFEYANGAAMYFEMALPVTLGLLLLFSSRQLVAQLFGEGQFSERARRVLQAALFVAVAIMTMAVLLTFSRAAWVGIVLAVGVFTLAALVKRRAPGEVKAAPMILRPLAAAVLVIAFGGAYLMLTQPLFRLRLTGENDRGWYRHTIIAGEVPSMSAGQTVTVPVTLRNDGELIWSPERAPLVNLSYHWKSLDKGSYPVFEGVRTRLPHEVQPGQTVTMNAYVKAPSKVGDYYLEWDLVQEDVAWFSVKTGITREPTLHKRAERAVGTANAPVPPPVAPPLINAEMFENTDTSTVARGTLWRVAFRMFREHPITGVGPDGFRHLYGKYAGTTDWNSNIYTNSMYVELFTNLGLVGGLAFVLLSGLALWRTVRNILREAVGPLWVVCLGAAAGVVAFYVHGVVDYFLFATPLYFIFWFLLAVSVQWPSLVRRAEAGITQ
ncbi:MAG TPA: O-antigen ligase family protein [Chloroflexia bacterium]|nr:O-antigen ligase family protein [Chloroflexia bacterium]